MPLRSSLALVVLCALSGLATAQSSDTAFTYQGKLDFQGQAYTGDADYRFTLWDADIGGNQIGADSESLGVAIDGGVFSAQLDFGAAALTQRRWIQIEVRTPAWDGLGPEPAYTMLDGRQPMTRSPYSVQTRGIIVNEAGNRVGINVNPAHPLHVDSTQFSTALIESSSPIGTWFNLYNQTSGGVSWKFIATGENNGEGPGKLLLATGAGPNGVTATIASLAPDGRIGLGTGSPRPGVHNTYSYYGRGLIELFGENGEGSGSDAKISAFDAAGSSAVGLRVFTTAAGQSPAERVRIHANGNVGIGISPSSDRRLAVSGGMEVLGAASFSGNASFFGNASFGGANAVISLGDSANDRAVVPGSLEFGDGSQQTTAYRPVTVDIAVPMFTIGSGQDFRFNSAPIAGVAEGTPVVVSPPADLDGGIIIGFALVRSDGSVRFSVVNIGSVSRVIGAGSWKATVFP